MMRSGVGALCCLALAASAFPRQVHAQSNGVSENRDLPDWLTSWSPLTRQGDLPRRLPSASVAMPLLLLPAPKVGLFWTGGNPAAIALEVTDSRSDMTASRAGQDGDYRRPLDPAAATTTRVSGFGWQPLGARGAVIGGALFDRTVTDPSSQSDMNMPYSSSSFVVTDTSVSALRQNRSRLEGAGGWRLGAWGVGLSLGYDARATGTVASPFLRRNRAVASGGTAGVARTFGQGRFRAGIRGTWQGGEETVTLIEVAQEGQVYQLEGYREVTRQEIAGAYYRRFSRDVRSAGTTAGGDFLNGTWVMHADVYRLRDRMTNQQQDDPIVELWSTSGVKGGGAVQLPVLARRGLLTVQGQVATLNGQADHVLPDRRGLVASERVFDASAQLRFAAGESWIALADASVLGEHRERTDSLPAAATTVDGITPRIAVEMGRSVGEKVWLYGGYAFARFGGSGSIPAANSRGPVYRRIFAPELDMATSVARSQAVSIASRWRAGSGASVWVAARLERLSPAGADQSFAPVGNRTARSVVLGVALGSDEFR